MTAQAPVVGLQEPLVLGAEQTFGVPTHVPFWQTSLSVQALPSLQLVPLGFAGFEH